ncbi:MAG: alpha-amylase family glycosyl hydrolase [Verrucomicrobiales bacterium]|nr:alpha-amylase family glycosyl hydrolase [Verrucomicrobiales bacterium]
MVEPDREKWERVRGRLELLYGGEAVPGVEAVLRGMVSQSRAVIAGEPPGGASAGGGGRWSERDALLISYGDSVLEEGKRPLEVLGEFLDERVREAVSMVHVLPFFPATSDDGFSVSDYRVVREDLGDWGDVKRLGRRHRVVFDAVLNHVSASSKYVVGHLGGDEAFEDFVIRMSPETELSRVVRPRASPLLHAFENSQGEEEWLWTTFSDDQVDLNFRNPRVLLEVLDVLLFYAAQGASMVRLDAIPYLWKREGTGCVHLKETHAIIKLVRDVYDLAAPGVQLLSETNVPHAENISYFGEGGDEAQMIYNFSLAPLVLFSLTVGDTTKLTRWAQGLGPYWRGCSWLNITATHDGIGMRPTEGILDEGERGVLLELATRHGGQVSYKRNPDGSVTAYELNLTYFDAVNDPGAGVAPEVEVARFLVSQAVAMVLKGVPGIYIHSLLGSRNNHAGVAATGRARSINREQLSRGVLEAELRDERTVRARVLRGMRRMLAVRRGTRAFDPESDQQVLEMGAGVFAVLRRCHDTGERVLALHNVTSKRVKIDRRQVPVKGPLTDRLTGQLVWMGELGEDVVLLPYQVAWLA